MLQRVRDLKVQYDSGTLSDEDKKAIAAEVQQLGKEIKRHRGQDRVQRHEAARRPARCHVPRSAPTRPTRSRSTTIDCPLGAAPAASSSSSTSAARRPSTAARRPFATADGRRHRQRDQERLVRALDVRRGAEPPRAPPQQPRDLPGEPGRVREPDPRRGHGLGDGQLHEAPDPAAGRHEHARAGQPGPAGRSLAPALAPRLHNPTEGRIAAGGSSGPPVGVKGPRASCRTSGREPIRPTLCVVPAFVRNEEELDVLLRCLVSLRSTAPDADVLVVDDASPARELVAGLEAVCEELGIALVSNDENSGFSRHRQRRPASSRSQTGRDAVLVNADIEFLEPGWLERMRARTDTEGRPAAVVGARLLYPNGLIQHAGIFLSAAAPRLAPPLPVRARRPPRGARADALPRHRRAAADPPRDARAGRPLRRGLPDVLRGRRLLPARVRGRPRVHLRADRASPRTARSSSAARPTPRSSAGRASRPPACSTAGAGPTCPVGPGGAVMSLPKTLFLVARLQRRRLVPLRAPRARARRRLGRLRRRAAGRRSSSGAASQRAARVRRHRRLRRRRAPAAARRRLAARRSASWQARGIVVLFEIDDWVARRPQDATTTTSPRRSTSKTVEDMRAVHARRRRRHLLDRRGSPTATARSTRPPTSAATGIDLKRYALTRARARPRDDRLGRRRPATRDACARGSREVAKVMRGRPDDALRHRRPAVRRLARAEEFGPSAPLAIPFARARHLPGRDDAVRHRARPGRQGQLLPRQERPALARGRRAGHPARRRPGRVPGDRARRHRLPRRHARRDRARSCASWSTTATLRERVGAAAKAHVDRAPQRPGRRRAAGPRCCARSRATRRRRLTMSLEAALARIAQLQAMLQPPPAAGGDRSRPRRSFDARCSVARPPGRDGDHRGAPVQRRRHARRAGDRQRDRARRGRRRRAAARLQRLAAHRPVPPGHGRLGRRPVVRLLRLLGRPPGGRADRRRGPGLRPRRRRVGLGPERRQGAARRQRPPAARRPDRLGRAHRRRRVGRRRRHIHTIEGNSSDSGRASAPTGPTAAAPSATCGSADVRLAAPLPGGSASAIARSSSSSSQRSLVSDE